MLLKSNLKVKKCAFYFAATFSLFVMVFEITWKVQWQEKRIELKATEENEVSLFPEEWQISASDYIRTKVGKRKSIMNEIRQYHKDNYNEAKKKLPGVILIGARKCGTGGVVRFLQHHPLIYLPIKELETSFFINNFRFGMEYYKNLFPSMNDRDMGIEKTPTYFDCSDPELPKRVKENIPNVKILLIVCDPTARTFSDFIHQKLGDPQRFRSYATFDEFVDVYLEKVSKSLETPEAKKNYAEKLKCRPDYTKTIVTSGLFYFHVQKWWKLFNQSNFKILDGEKYLEDPGTILEEIQDFIGVPKLLWKEDFVRNPRTGFHCYRELTEDLLNQPPTDEESLINSLSCMAKDKGRSRNGVRTISNRTKARLDAFFEPYNKMFAKTVGRKFSWA